MILALPAAAAPVADAEAQATGLADRAMRDGRHRPPQHLDQP